MDGGFTRADLGAGIKRLATKIESSADELNKLDGELGDGDLGVTMVRGVRGLVEETANLPDDVGMALLKCAQVFTKVSGSTFGTLLATGLMIVAKKTKGSTTIPWGEISDLLGEALEGMTRRGKSSLGDKTVLDALEAARMATSGLDDPGEIAAAADRAVAEALEQFRNQTSRQGRARIFGDKSVGLDDPGMLAFKRIVESFL